MLINVHFCDVGQVGATTETELKEPVCQRPQGEGYFLLFFSEGVIFEFIGLLSLC